MAIGIRCSEALALAFATSTDAFQLLKKERLAASGLMKGDMINSIMTLMKIDQI